MKVMRLVFRPPKAYPDKFIRARALEERSQSYVFIGEDRTTVARVPRDVVLFVTVEPEEPEAPP